MDECAETLRQSEFSLDSLVRTPSYFDPFSYTLPPTIKQHCFEICLIVVLTGWKVSILFVSISHIDIHTCV